MAERERYVRSGGIRLRVLEWGRPSSDPVVILHGWGDSAATFAPMAETLAARWRVIGPDLRGFGGSGWADGGYWFPDYLGDLDTVMESCAGSAPCALIGHSMGGNVAGLYAGVRPERIRALALLEGFGLSAIAADAAPARYRDWLEQRGRAPLLRDFDDRAALLAHLRRLAPRAPDGVLDLVAEAWAMPVGQGAWRLRMDPRHKRLNPVLYRRDEAAACWAATTAPVLLVYGLESDLSSRVGDRDPVQAIAACYRDVRIGSVPQAGHMLHWEQPAVLAAMLGDFLAAVGGE